MDEQSAIEMYEQTLQDLITVAMRELERSRNGEVRTGPNAVLANCFRQVQSSWNVLVNRHTSHTFKLIRTTHNVP